MHLTVYYAIGNTYTNMHPNWDPTHKPNPTGDQIQVNRFFFYVLETVQVLQPIMAGRQSVSNEKNIVNLHHHLSRFYPQHNAGNKLSPLILPALFLYL